MNAQPMLKVDNLTKKFGNLVAVCDVSLEIFPGEIVGLIGPNGAGKTTLFNAITGLYKPEAGRVTYKGTNITGLLPHKICQLGMSRTFQVTRAFVHMTVEDTIRVGAYNRCGEKNVQARVDEVIALCDLETSAIRYAATWGWPPCARSSWPAPWRPSPTCSCWTKPARA